MANILTIAHLTLFEARRRRIVVAATICGTLFLVLFTVAMFFVDRAMRTESLLEQRATLVIFSMFGLFAVNFLTVLFAILLPIDALSGEIDSGVIQTIAAKPVGRAAIVLGKWLGHAAIVFGYLIALSLGVVLAMRVGTGYVVPNLLVVLPLMMLEAALLISVSIAGGTRLSTVTNGVVGVGFYGLAFIGGWIEQIGAFASVDSAQTIGIAVSLVSPADTVWRLALWELQPAIVRSVGGGNQGPFTLASVPSALMIWWAAGFTLLTIVYAVRSFKKRAL
jgi:Cu-processing system permease protein